MTSPTSKQARDAVNVFTSVDVLGLLDYKDYPGTSSTIEAAIKDHYNSKPINDDLKKVAMKRPLQQWNVDKRQYEFSGIWDEVISEVKKKGSGNYQKVFASTAGTKDILGKFVRLVANRGDTQGWKLAVNQSDLVTKDGVKYLTDAYNLSIKAKPAQWIRWWGNSTTPFSAIQCVVGSITASGRPHNLPELQHQQDVSVTYKYPSGTIEGTRSDYTTATSVAFSHMGQLKPNNKVGKKIPYDIKFNVVDPQGDTIASFQVDPEIIVI